MLFKAFWWWHVGKDVLVEVFWWRYFGGDRWKCGSRGVQVELEGHKPEDESGSHISSASVTFPAGTDGFGDEVGRRDAQSAEDSQIHAPVFLF